MYASTALSIRSFLNFMLLHSETRNKSEETKTFQFQVLAEKLHDYETAEVTCYNSSDWKVSANYCTTPTSIGDYYE